MGWLNDLEDSLGRFNRKVDELKAYGKPPRKLTEDDRDKWDFAAATRKPPPTRAEIIASISAANPVMYARVRRNMKWLEKQAVKRGLSPEDARWLV